MIGLAAIRIDLLSFRCVLVHSLLSIFVCDAFLFYFVSDFNERALLRYLTILFNHAHLPTSCGIYRLKADSLPLIDGGLYVNFTCCRYCALLHYLV